MRHLIKIAALPLLLLVLGGHARAAENEGKVIALSCEAVTEISNSGRCSCFPVFANRIGAAINLALAWKASGIFLAGPADLIRFVAETRA